MGSCVQYGRNGRLCANRCSPEKRSGHPQPSCIVNLYVQIALSATPCGQHLGGELVIEQGSAAGLAWSWSPLFLSSFLVNSQLREPHAKRGTSATSRINPHRVPMRELICSGSISDLPAAHISSSARRTSDVSEALSRVRRKGWPNRPLCIRLHCRSGRGHLCAAGSAPPEKDRLRAIPHRTR